MKVILISGRAQNGKDTIAKLMQTQLQLKGKRVLITHYADLLKFICRNYFGWDGNKDETGRKILQHIGTDVIRKENPSLWVDFVAMMLKYFKDEWDYVIIPDCRFPNEISVMVDNGFDVTHVRVIRTNFDDGMTENQRNHQSETALDNIKPDFYIHNDGTLTDLKASVNKLIKENLYADKY